MNSIQAWVLMVGPMELLGKIAPTPTQSGGDESRAATLALRLIAALLEEIAACSLSELAGRINAEGRGSAATKRQRTMGEGGTGGAPDC